MAKNRTEIKVTTVFDGEQDATDVFVRLIAQKYSAVKGRLNLAEAAETKYNEGVQIPGTPSGLCG